MNETDDFNTGISTNESSSSDDNSNIELPKLDFNNEIKLPKLNMKEVELPKVNLNSENLLNSLKLSNVSNFYPKIKPVQIPQIKNPLIDKVDSIDMHLNIISENSEKVLQSIDKLISVNIDNNNISEQYLSEISNKLDTIVNKNDSQNIPQQIIDEAKNSVITKGVDYAFAMLLAGLKMYFLKQN